MLFEKNQRIVFMGDSVTDFGRMRPIGEGLHDGVGTGYVRVIHSMINGFYPELGLRISNMGISGNNILDLEKRWQSDCLELKPDWVSICIGINDVWRFFDSPDIYDLHVSEEVYEKTYRKIIEKTKPIVKGIILMTPYYMEPEKNDSMRAKMDVYGGIVKKLSEEYNCISIDTQLVFDKYLKLRHSSFVAWDRVHPNHVGALLIANEFLKKTGFDYERMSKFIK